MSTNKKSIKHDKKTPEKKPSAKQKNSRKTKPARKNRKPDAEVLKIIANLRLIDDIFFEKFAEDAPACEELLQVILENPKLRIKPETLVAQKTIRNIAKRSIRADAYMEGIEDKVFNIEIQRADNCNHVKRVRYNASAITVVKSEPGDTFDDVQDVIIIYISEFDIFGEGKTVYHVENRISETSKPVNDGLMTVYVNTAITDSSRIGELMKHFKEPDFSDESFPNISRRMNELKHSKSEEMLMCKSVEEYSNRKAKEAIKKAEKAEEKAVKAEKAKKEAEATVVKKDKEISELKKQIEELKKRVVY